MEAVPSEQPLPGEGIMNEACSPCGVLELAWSLGRAVPYEEPLETSSQGFMRCVAGMGSRHEGWTVVGRGLPLIQGTG